MRGVASSAVDHPEPKIESPTQAKIRMLNVGICGTDKEIGDFQYGTPPDGSGYLVIERAPRYFSSRRRL